MAVSINQQFSRPRRCTVLANYEKTVLSAFKWDCEAFLEQFEKENTFNYADFAKIWQLNSFTFIYADQTYVGPLNVLCEVCFLTVKKYIMFQKSLNIKVGAFYLLYGLYYKQPIENLVKIRLTLKEYRKIKELMNEMLKRGQHDILYIFAKMKSDNAFLYVAEPKPIVIELNKSIKSTTHIDDTFQARGSESSLIKFKDILENDTVKKLQDTCNEYDTLLEKFAEKYPSVNKFKSTVIEEVHKAHRNVFDQATSAFLQNSDPEDNTGQSFRQKIRQKAMTNKNAVYRGSKKVLTAVDLGMSDDDDDDDFD